MLGAGFTALTKLLDSKESVNAAASNEFDGAEGEEGCCDCVAWVEHEKQRKIKAGETKNFSTIKLAVIYITHCGLTSKEKVDKNDR